MQLLIRLAVILVVSAAIAGVVRPATAQKPAAPVIIVVDLRKIEREATATKSIREQIDAKQKSYQFQLAKRENELRQEDQELRRQQAILSAEALAQKRQQLSRRAGELQRDVQNYQRALQRARDKSLAVVRRKVIDIIAKLVLERGANFALDKTFVVFVRTDQNLDVTNEILARLNKEIPDVTVEAAAE